MAYSGYITSLSLFAFACFIQGKYEADVAQKTSRDKQDEAACLASIRHHAATAYSGHVTTLSLNSYKLHVSQT